MTSDISPLDKGNESGRLCKTFKVILILNVLKLYSSGTYHKTIGFLYVKTSLIKIKSSVFFRLYLFSIFVREGMFKIGQSSKWKKRTINKGSQIDLIPRFIIRSKIYQYFLFAKNVSLSGVTICLNLSNNSNLMLKYYFGFLLVIMFEWGKC